MEDFALSLTRLPCTFLESTTASDMHTQRERTHTKKRRYRFDRKGLRAYRVELAGGTRFVFLGFARNRQQAEAALQERFGAAVQLVRVHPLFDPWRVDS